MDRSHTSAYTGIPAKHTVWKPGLLGCSAAGIIWLVLVTNGNESLYFGTDRADPPGCSSPSAPTPSPSSMAGTVQLMGFFFVLLIIYIMLFASRALTPK